MGVKVSGKGGSLSGKTGYQGSTTLVSSNVTVGAPQALMQASFEEPTVYSCLFTLTTAGVLPIPTPSPIWPPPFAGPNGNEPLPPPALVASQPVANTQNIRAVALVTWSIEGVSFRRQLDVGSGAEISAAAQAIAVSVWDATATVGGPNNQQYGVSCGVTREVRATNEIPTYWLGAGKLLHALPSSQAILTIPQDVGVNSVEVVIVDDTVAGGAVNITVEQLVGAVSQKSYIVASGGDLGFVRMAPGVQALLLSNNSGTDDVLYYVTLGIDG